MIHILNSNYTKKYIFNNHKRNKKYNSICELFLHLIKLFALLFKINSFKIKYNINLLISD